jgi:hypothetical protein
MRQKRDVPGFLTRSIDIVAIDISGRHASDKLPGVNPSMCSHCLIFCPLRGIHSMRQVYYNPSKISFKPRRDDNFCIKNTVFGIYATPDDAISIRRRWH